MNPICPAGHNVTFRAEGCGDLPARKEPAEGGGVSVTTLWLPTGTEREMIARGKPVTLAMLIPETGSIPPVSVFVEGAALLDAPLGGNPS